MSACNPGGSSTATPEGQSESLPTAVLHITRIYTSEATSEPAAMPAATAMPTKAITKDKCELFLITAQNVGDKTNTIQALIDYINTDGKAISKLSQHFFVEANVRKYLERLMDEAGLQNLNTNHLAYIYATTHLESGWGDFEELYDGEPTEQAKKEHFETLYGEGTIAGGYLGNTETLDGYTFLGRGFIHLTGRKNYQAISVELGKPELMEADGFILAACSHTGCAKKYDYDFITKIAVIGMMKGTFTDISLLSPDLNGVNDGSFNFIEARSIIGWSGDKSDIKAADLARGYAKILSKQCVKGEVSEGLTCVPCPY